MSQSRQYPASELSPVPSRPEQAGVFGADTPAISITAQQLTAELARVDQNLQAGPVTADLWLQRAKLQRALKQPAAAVSACDAALSLQGDWIAAWLLRGQVQQETGQFAAALASYQQALQCQPQLPEILSLCGDLLQQLGRQHEALAHYDQALALKVELPVTWCNRAGALLALGRPEDALDSYDHALEIQPDFALAWCNRGNALLELKRYDDALASQTQALQHDPNLIDALNNRGNLLRYFNRHPQALLDYQRAIALQPDFALAHLNLGHTLRELNRIEAARTAFTSAIRLAPNALKPYRGLASVTRLTPSDPCYLALEHFATHSAQLNLADQIELCFALGDALTQFSEHARAFAYFRQGNALQHSLGAYNEPATLAYLHLLRDTVTRTYLDERRGGGELAETPVFIIGMPRSGSTLIEQILASHPAVYGAGEYTAFSAELDAYARRQQRTKLDAPLLSALRSADFTAIGRGYQQRIAQLGGIEHGYLRVVDKSLLNFIHLGLLHLALPNARFIHARRNPVETCLSCFSKLLSNMPFSFELGELGRYYVAYDRLMAHWREVLPAGVMLEVDYEAMTDDLPTQARRILAHCQLEWDPACLAFEHTERPIATASALQVRQPLYQHAVRRWRPEPALLAPLLAELGALASAA